MQSFKQLENYFNYNLHITPINKIYSDVKKIKNKEQLLKNCEALLKEKTIINIEAKRIAIIKVLVSLFPSSFEIIRKLLYAKNSKDEYEIHFTLFCFLNYLKESNSNFVFKEELLLEINNYLKTIPKKTSAAAWMLGDMLGDHWDLAESIPILIEAAKNAKYSAGRLGALHGLEHALGNKPMYRDSLILTLKDISTRDKSEEVKKYASSMLKESMHI